MKVTTDVDIDVYDRDMALEGLEHVRASIIRDDGSVEKHNTGVYFQPIPKDPLTNRALIDHKDAEERGYFKIDFLNVSLYKDVRDEQHLNSLLNKEPDWELLTDELFVSQLFHIGNHYALIKKLSPKSVDQLAAALAIIRPAKKYLENKSWNEIEKDVWVKPKDESYFFKRSHAVAYALAIVVQMNLIVEQLSE